MSRSPSPLGLIPIHQKWRSFVSPTLLSHLRSHTVTDSPRSTVMKFLGRSSTSRSASSRLTYIAPGHILHKFTLFSSLSLSLSPSPTYSATDITKSTASTFDVWEL
jgi:hypothetical protein